MSDMPQWLHEEAVRKGFAKREEYRYVWNINGYNWAYIVWHMIKVDRKRRKKRLSNKDSHEAENKRLKELVADLLEDAGAYVF